MVYSPGAENPGVNRKLLISVSLVNLILVALLVARVHSIDSDKSIALLVFFYLALVVINLLIGIVLQFIRPVQARVFFVSVGTLLLALIPLMIILSFIE
jgi:hypothetical protein